jgi:hypothetical protein
MDESRWDQTSGRNKNFNASFRAIAQRNKMYVYHETKGVKEQRNKEAARFPKRQAVYGTFFSTDTPNRHTDVLSLLHLHFIYSLYN